MVSKTMGQLLIDLEVTRSFSRPHISDDNPYSESQFKTMKYSPHRPHGLGQFDRTPPEPESDAIRLMTDLSPEATRFLKTIAPKGLDRYGWHMIATAPVLGWPSAEILAAISKDERLSALIPIDVLGMRTDLNPGRLYR